MLCENPPRSPFSKGDAVQNAKYNVYILVIAEGYDHAGIVQDKDRALGV